VKKDQLKKIIYPIVLIAFIAGIVFSVLNNNNQEKETKPLKEAIGKVKNNQVKKIEVLNSSQAVKIYFKDEDKKSVEYGIPNKEGAGGFDQLIKEANKKDVLVFSEPIQNTQTLASRIVQFLPTLILILILVAFAYFSKLGPFGKVKVAPSKTGVTFDDVAGCDEAIEELKEIELFILNPKRFSHLGAKSPKGVLLYGPPGTGKTLLAKALAGEAKINFYAVSGSEFIEIYAGVGARRVRQLFEEAKKNSPAIIFIDEIDAIATTRSSGMGDGASREADQTINEILRQMDGFDSNDKEPVIVIGATNRLDVLDPAVIRPGRFDRQIAVDAPDRSGREEILRVHSSDKLLAEDVDLNKIAIQTAGMTGAELARLLNEAALHAARRNAKEISKVDIDDAYFRVVAGAKKQNRVLSTEELEKISYHESGHAIVGERLSGGNIVHKISIIPRGRSGGQTLYVSEEDVFLYSKEHLEDMICSLLAGRAAEEIIFNKVSSGAADDLQRASELATKMVTELGMSEKIGLRVVKGKSHEVDSEVKEILAKEYRRAEKILSEERHNLDDLATTLLKEEVIDRNDFLKIIND
jgi:cell division protease FtsH